MSDEIEPNVDESDIVPNQFEPGTIITVVLAICDSEHRVSIEFDTIDSHVKEAPFQIKKTPTPLIFSLPFVPKPLSPCNRCYFFRNIKSPASLGSVIVEPEILMAKEAVVPTALESHVLCFRVMFTKVFDGSAVFWVT